MNKLKGFAYLKNKLNQKRPRVLTRYDFYEMKNLVLDLDISTPPDLKHMMSSLGWCGKAVDSLADRLQLATIRNDASDMNRIYKLNNPDVFFDSAIKSALISSCCFVYISADEDGFPRLQVIDGSNATGILDYVTGLLTEGYAVLERDADTGNPTIEAYFEPYKTTIYRVNEEPVEYPNDVAYPLLVPIIYKPDAKREFGHSRISRACMDIQNSAIRTMKRSEIASEFYSYPQKYVTGLSQDAEALDKWKATMSSMITFTNDEDGNHPQVGQFQTASMTPHTEQLRMFASLFAGETGLTLDDLGFASGNPSSFDAIKASHENLRLCARKAQRNFSSGLLNVGLVAVCLRDNTTYKREKFYETKMIWMPVFEPDGGAMSGIGDAVIKINQVIPDFFDKQTLADFLGVEVNE
ncbi:MAG: phage portal protein [Paludibacteraceae bacterium]|nr:phage portal protein [Paludibacteraceae bacterium]